jgi:peptidoglycan hydrolase-like protein with peptidoglycan-binding domain
MIVFTSLIPKFKRTIPFLSGLFLGVFSIMAVATLFQFFLSPPGAKSAPGATVSAPLLSRNLRLGDKGEDVRILQRFLNQNSLTQVSKSGPGSPLNESTYFGPLTKNAVIRFQELYAADVLTPVGLLAGTGFVGPFTRQKINIISGALTQIPSQITTSSVTSSALANSSNGPIITDLSPISGIDGTQITLTGSGFAATNTILAGFARLENVPSLDDKTLTFTVNSGIPEKDKPYHLPLVYTISVAIDGRQSNPKTFTLTLPEGQAYIPDSERQVYKQRVLDFMRQKGFPLN